MVSKKLQIKYEMNEEILTPVNRYLEKKNTTIEKEIEKEIEKVVERIVNKTLPKDVRSYMVMMGIINDKNDEKVTGKVKENLESLNQNNENEPNENSIENSVNESNSINKINKFNNVQR